MATLFKRKRKSGYVYYVTGYVNGKHFMRSTKTADKKVAMEMLRKIEENIIRIEDGLEPVDKLKPILLSEFINIYLEDRRRLGKAKRTVSTDEYSLRRLLNFTGDCALTSITEKVAHQYRKFKDETIKPASASIELRALRTAFNWAGEKPGEKYLRVNPFAKKGMIPKVKAKNIPLCLSPGEKARFLSIIKNEKHLQLFKFYLLTGCRRSEALNLQWSDIDLEQKQLTFKKTKTKKERTLPISLELMQVIMSLDRSQPKPFDYTSHWVIHLFKRYRDKAGIRKSLHLHCLRHTAASDLVRKGIHLTKIAKMLGHSSTATTEIYTHVVPNDLLEAAEALTCVG